MSAPYQPVNVVLQTGNGQNFLIWDPVVGADSYLVQRSLDGITFLALGGSFTTNTYLDSTAVVGTTYFYQVASVSGTDISTYTPSFPPSIVPCLPGQINLAYLRYMSQLRADKLNSQYLTIDEWNFNINQSINSLYDLLVTKFGDDYFFAEPVYIPLTGLDKYPLPNGGNYQLADLSYPPAVYKLNGVDVNLSGNDRSNNAGWLPLARANWSDRDRFTLFPGQSGAFNNICQMFYRPMGSNLHVFPSNSNQLIRLWYVPVLTQLLQETDMLTFSISGWSEWVINDAAMKAMVKEESFEKWTALSQANEKIEIRIESVAANRDAGQPNTVSNVRATMGDPSFSNWGNGGWGGGFGSGGFGG